MLRIACFTSHKHTHTHTHPLIGTGNKEQRKLLFKKLIKFIKNEVFHHRPLRVRTARMTTARTHFFANHALMTIIDEDSDSDKTLTDFILQKRYR